MSSIVVKEGELLQTFSVLTLSIQIKLASFNFRYCIPIYDTYPGNSRVRSRIEIYFIYYHHHTYFSTNYGLKEDTHR